MATQMNAALSEDNEQGMFVTMFIGLVHLPTGHLDFCNAGHNPPVLTGEEKSSFLQMETNAPIGLWPELKFVGEEIESMKGQSLFVYTDGLNEAENTFKEQFGEDRLLAMVKEVGRQSSRQVIEALETAVTEHRGGSEPNDDLTMMCVRVC
jgi:serine phosphatase RsbU (regulator of sigma subunit)